MGAVNADYPSLKMQAMTTTLLNAMETKELADGAAKDLAMSTFVGEQFRYTFSHVPDGQNNGPTFRGMVDANHSDGTDLTNGVAKSLIVTVSGTVKANFADGSTNTFQAVAGTVYNFAVKRIWSTGTTATGVKVIY